MCDAEVGDPRVSVGQQNVLGLDVAVDHMVAVGVVQRVGDLPGDPHGILHRESPLSLEPVPKTLSLYVWHGVPQRAGGVPRVEHGQNVRVVQASRYADLTQKALDPYPDGEVGMEHFERDGSIVLDVVGKVDRGHASTPELVPDAVGLGQICLESSRSFHG